MGEAEDAEEAEKVEKVGVRKKTEFLGWKAKKFLSRNNDLEVPLWLEHHA